MRVSTHLMFQEGVAKEALAFYGGVFPDFVVRHLESYVDGEGATPGLIKQAWVAFRGHELIVIDSPVRHEFDFTPSMSLFVDLDSDTELEAAFATLAEGGQTMMPLDDYGFSRRFGWVVDRFGVSWQLNLPAD